MGMRKMRKMADNSRNKSEDRRHLPRGIPRPSLRAILSLLLIVGLGMLLLGSVLEQTWVQAEPPTSWFVSKKTWVPLSKEIGFAALIALLLSYTIEQYTRRVHEEERQEEKAELKRNVFEAVYGILAPEHVVDRIVKSTLGQKFWRTNYRVYFELHLHDFSREDGVLVKGVRLRSHHSYTIKNISHEPEDYELRIEVEKPDLRGVRESIEVEQIIINGKEIDKKSLVEQERDVIKQYSYKWKVNRGEIATINFCVTVGRGLDDTELWWSFIPSDGMTLQVKLPPEITEFGAFPIHETDLVKSQSSATGYHEWELRDVVLPYQGIALWWRYSEQITTDGGAEKNVQGTEKGDSRDSRK